MISFISPFIYHFLPFSSVPFLLQPHSQSVSASFCFPRCQFTRAVCRLFCCRATTQRCSTSNQLRVCRLVLRRGLNSVSGLRGFLGSEESRDRSSRSLWVASLDRTMCPGLRATSQITWHKMDPVSNSTNSGTGLRSTESGLNAPEPTVNRTSPIAKSQAEIRKQKQNKIIINGISRSTTMESAVFLINFEWWR